MRVSVIIPYVETNEALQRALDSVKAQTRQPNDLIPMLDRHRVGPAMMRNEGIKMTNSELILCLDSDDWIEPTFLEKTGEQMAPYMGIVSTDMQYFARGKEIIETPVRTYDSQLRQNLIPCCSLFRKEAWEQAGGYDPTLPGWEDWDLWIRILKLGWEHSVVPEPLFHYNVHNHGMNAKADANKETLKARMGEKHPEFLELRKTGRTWNGI